MLWAIHTTPHSATGETSYSLSFGSETVIPTELNIPNMRVPHYNPTDNEEDLRQCHDELEERRDLARVQIVHHQHQISKYYNHKVKTRRFDPGDLVLKKVISSTRNPSLGSLGDNWKGPYIIDSVSMRGA